MVDAVARAVGVAEFGVGVAEVGVGVAVPVGLSAEGDGVAATEVNEGLGLGG